LHGQNGYINTPSRYRRFDVWPPGSRNGLIGPTGVTTMSFAVTSFATSQRRET
jgi:hypothetical protein